MYLENNLAKRGRLTIAGQKMDLAAVRVPTYAMGAREDHIVPWESAYRSVTLLKGEKRFVLGASGHIAGVINPPAKGKRCYWTNNTLADTAHDWQARAQEHPGSWWTDWSEWLKPHAGALVSAPKTIGSRTHKPIEPAPGRYVKAKA
jgi:polyhydroxyalkanoate synthase